MDSWAEKGMMPTEGVLEGRENGGKKIPLLLWVKN